MVAAMSDGAVTITNDGVILYCNQRFADMVRADLGKVMGSSFLTRFEGDDATRIVAAIREIEIGIQRVPATMLASDGTSVPVNVAMHGQSDGETPSVAIVVTDLTEWRRINEARERSNRALHMIIGCNQVIIRATDESLMFSDLCKTILAVGGYKLAWIGCAEHDDAKSVRPVAQAGSDGGYVKNAQITWADTERGRGPTGTAIRTGRLTIARDTETEPDYEPWRRMARDEGYRSSAALPLRSGQDVFGALMVYSDAPNAFDEEESLLLTRLADDIVFGITALRNKQSRDRLAAIVDSAGDAIIGRDRAGTVMTWNEAAERMFGYSAAEIVGRSIGMLVPAELAGDSDRLFAKMAQEATPEHFETIRVTKDGRHIVVSITYSPIQDTAGSIVAAAMIIRDITERKQTEAELARHRQHLEELVAARTADLAQANQNLEAANHELESFAYSVSHDLRAPLRAIDGFSQVLVEDYEEKLGTEGKRILQIVRNGATKMGRLIDDILAFSRVSRQTIAASKTDMGSLVQDALRELAPAMADRSIEMKIGPLPYVHGDRAMLERVWTNLLQNAIKFTGPKPNPVVEVGARPEGGETVFFVKDNGVGFDMRYADKLFGVFHRLHTMEEFPGTGIGLAIVNRIVTKHGGRVWAESTVGEGATFYFALPRANGDHA